MKRKTIAVVLAVIAAILLTIKQEFGLSINLAGFFGFIALAAAYIRGEAARDVAAIRQQSSKWGDPKFLTVLAAAIVTALNNQLGWSIPMDVVNTILVFVVWVLFKKRVATKPS